MDPYSPHPPIDNIFFLFVAFIRSYNTTLHPFNFLLNVPEDQIPAAFHQHSHNARHVLLQIYGLFQPFVQHSPIHRQMLQEYYMFAVNAIHTKFGTHPQYALPPPTAPDTTTNIQLPQHQQYQRPQIPAQQMPHIPTQQRPLPPLPTTTTLSNIPLPPLLQRRQ